MLSNLWTVSEQVIIIFILILVGFILGKIKLITQEGAKILSNIVLFAVTPCVIIKSFQRAYDASMLKELLLGFLISFCILVASIFIVELLYIKKGCDRVTVIKFAIVFSNAGFVGLPLQEAILGENGVFFGSAYVAVFNVVLWSYGYFIMSGKKDYKSMAKGIINPGIIGTLIAMVLFVCKVTLPNIIYTPISFLAGLNTPIPMLIVGFYLASTSLADMFKSKDVYISLLFRLIIIPLLSVFILYFIGIRGDLYIAMVIATATPTAVATTLMSSRYNKDTTLASSIVSASSLVSIITMPLIVALAQTLIGG